MSSRRSRAPACCRSRRCSDSTASCSKWSSSNAGNRSASTLPAFSCASAPKPRRRSRWTRHALRSKSGNCAKSGRHSISNTRASRRRYGNASTARAKKPMHRPPNISRSWRRRESKRVSGATNSSPRQPRTRRACSLSRATGARSSAGCATPITRGEKAIWAASNRAHGKSSTRGSRLCSRRCAMRCRRCAIERRRIVRR